MVVLSHFTDARLVICVIKWSRVLTLGTVLRLFFCVYMFNFSLVTLSVLSTHVQKVSNSVTCIALHSLGLYTLVWSCVWLSHNFHISVQYCASSLAGIGASCPSRASHPCGGHLCPCSLFCLNSVVAGAG